MPEAGTGRPQFNSNLTSSARPVFTTFSPFTFSSEEDLSIHMWLSRCDTITQSAHNEHKYARYSIKFPWTSSVSFALKHA